MSDPDFSENQQPTELACCESCGERRKSWLTQVPSSEPAPPAGSVRTYYDPT